MATISNEIRNKIAELDQVAGNLIEMINDEHGSVPDDMDLYDFLEFLDEVQNKITEVQEAQGWLQ